MEERRHSTTIVERKEKSCRGKLQSLVSHWMWRAFAFHSQTDRDTGVRTESIRALDRSTPRRVCVCVSASLSSAFHLEVETRTTIADTTSHEAIQKVTVLLSAMLNARVPTKTKSFFPLVFFECRSNRSRIHPLTDIRLSLPVSRLKYWNLIMKNFDVQKVFNIHYYAVIFLWSKLNR